MLDAYRTRLGEAARNDARRITETPVTATDIEWLLALLLILGGVSVIFATAIWWMDQ